jgi:putative addiction module component (TIGR02574 family)
MEAAMTAKTMMKEARKLSLGQRAWLGCEILKDVEKNRGSAEPISDDIKRELARRWKEHLRNPDAGFTREEVRKRLQQLKKKSRA